jgi:hypothetical protein
MKSVKEKHKNRFIRLGNFVMMSFANPDPSFYGWCGSLAESAVIDREWRSE